MSEVSEVTDILRDLFGRILADPDDASGVLADLDTELVRSGLVDADLSMVDVEDIARQLLLDNDADVSVLRSGGRRSADGRSQPEIGRYGGIVQVRQIARLVGEASHSDRDERGNDVDLD